MISHAATNNPAQSNTTTSFINDNQTTQHQTPLDINAIANDVEGMKYYEGDDTNTIKQRLKRCIKKVKKGQWRKADAALGEGASLDLNVNNKWTKTYNKFPDATPIKPIPTTNHPHAPKTM